MEEYLSWDELLQHWKIKDFQLLDVIDDGLIPYNKRSDRVPVRIVNHKNLPDGFLNSIGRSPTHEELKGVELEALKLYAGFIFEGYFPNEKGILEHLPKYIIENMVQTILTREETGKETDFEDITITIDLKKPEQLQQLDGLMFRQEDIKATEKRNNGLALDEQKENPLLADQVATLPTVQTSAAKLVTLTPVQEDKWDARKAAEKYIRGCKKGSVPSIKEAVAKVKAILVKSYQDKTIRKWIKDIFPPESRKPGRRPKKEQ